MLDPLIQVWDLGSGTIMPADFSAVPILFLRVVEANLRDLEEDLLVQKSNGALRG